jgi:hypothetical protein
MAGWRKMPVKRSSQYRSSKAKLCRPKLNELGTQIMTQADIEAGISEAYAKLR